jgi:RNA polymerase sigma-70 factor (ECF subfamily)
MTDEDERRLVEAAQQDPSRFGDLYDRHFARVYAFVVSRVRDRATAEDITADVFHRALAGLPRYEWRGAPFGAWLIRIAANTVADRMAKAGREVSAGEDVADAAVAPDLDRFEAQARLFELVERLPGAQRAVIHERFEEGRSIREIAVRLDRSEGAIKQLQFRALQTLRSQMEGADI